jgi:hypothetical protein
MTLPLVNQFIRLKDLINDPGRWIKLWTANWLPAAIYRGNGKHQPVSRNEATAAWMQVSRTPRSIFELGMALPGVGEALKQEIA